MKNQKPASLSSSLLARQGEARPVPSSEGEPEEGFQSPSSPEMQAQYDALAERLSSGESGDDEPAPGQGEEAAPKAIPRAQEVRARVTLTDWAQRPSREAEGPGGEPTMERSDPDSAEEGTLRARGFMFVIVAAVLGSLIGLWLGKDERPAAPSGPAANATLQPGTQAAPEATSRNIIVAPLGPAASRSAVSEAPPPQAAAPPPSIQARPAAKPPAASTASALTGAYAVQLSSARSEEVAAREWTKLAQQHAALLGGIAHEIAQAEVAGRGTYFRLRVGGFDAADEARDLCTALKTEGQDCLVVKR